MSIPLKQLCLHLGPDFKNELRIGAHDILQSYLLQVYAENPTWELTIGTERPLVFSQSLVCVNFCSK